MTLYSQLAVRVSVCSWKGTFHPSRGPQSYVTVPCLAQICAHLVCFSRQVRASEHCSFLRF